MSVQIVAGANNANTQYTSCLRSLHRRFWKVSELLQNAHARALEMLPVRLMLGSEASDIIEDPEVTEKTSCTLFRCAFLEL